MPLVPAVFQEAFAPQEIPEQRRGDIPVVLQKLASEMYTPLSFIDRLLSVQHIYDEKREFVNGLPSLLEKVESNPGIIKWAVRLATKTCLRELQYLRQVPALRGNANTFTLKQLEEFNLHSISSNIERNAPHLVDFVTELLAIKPLDAPAFKADVTKMEKHNEGQRFLRHTRGVTILGIFLVNSNQKCNLLQATMGTYLHANHAPERVLSTLHHAGISISRSTILTMIDSLSKDATALLLQVLRDNVCAVAFDNFNLNFKKAQDTLVERRTHENLTTATLHILPGIVKADVDFRQQLYKRRVSGDWETADMEILALSSPDANGVTRDGRIDRAMTWQIVEQWIKNIPAFAYLKHSHGSTPGEVDQLPLRCDKQYPLRAMDKDESSLEGIIGVMEEIDRQCGWQEGVDDNQVRIFDGDLATVERAYGARLHRNAERRITSLREQLQHFIIRPGIFHLRMAATFAISRTYLEKKEVRKHDLSFMGFVRLLKPDDSNLLSSNPHYRPLHEVNEYTLAASMLDCGRLHAPGGSLKEWAEAKPSYEEVWELAKVVLQENVATMMGDIGDDENDAVFHNNRLLNRDLLLDAELAHCTNGGDIGRLEDILVPWIYLFKGTGQVKYAREMLQFLTDLKHNFPPRQAHAVRLGWLVNPTGKPGHWRGVDWVVEYDNLLIQTLFGKDPSRQTVEHILEGSNLIMVLKEILLAYDKNYQNISRTINHTTLDMSPKIFLLEKYMAKHRINESTTRSDLYKHRIRDAVATGVKKMGQQVGGEGEVDPVGEIQDNDDEVRGLSLSV